MDTTVRRYYLIDHRVLFLAGFMFYLLLPVILGRMELFNEYPGVELYQSFFKRIPESRINSYLLISFLWLFAFYLGHFCYKIQKPFKRSLQLFTAGTETKLIYFLAISLCVILLMFTYISKGALFGGGEYNVAARGKLSTLIVLFNFFLIYQLISNAPVSRLLIAGTIINALLLLIAGGRLTALQSLIIFLIYKTSFAYRRWDSRHILFLAFIGFFVGGAIGVWRVNASFSLERAGFSLLAEPLFTWFSTASFLASNDIPPLSLPLNFLTSFFNLVPNTVFSLRQYVVPAPAMGYEYVNPFGADSIWTTLIINFGYIGSFVFILFTGYILNYLRHLSESSRFWTTYYILVCAMLPFEFFRTGFFILNKQLFFNFMLMPAMILLIFKMLIYFQSYKKRDLKSELIPK